MDHFRTHSRVGNADKCSENLVKKERVVLNECKKIKRMRFSGRDMLRE